MTYRALELLNLPPDQPALLLDIGCGSGLSGEILDEQGHLWVGVDVAPSMLEVALEREVEGDLFLQDIGQGFGFRPGSFDGAISISVIQWLLNAETSHPTSSPPHRLTRFFTTLHASLRNPSRAVFQFYPTSDDQIQLITSIAQKAGFGGGIVVDYPNSNKAKKVFLCLFVGGGGGAQQMPEGLEAGEEDGSRVRFETARERLRQRGKGKKLKSIKDKDWILRKKEVIRKWTHANRYEGHWPILLFAKIYLLRRRNGVLAKERIGGRAPMKRGRPRKNFPYENKPVRSNVIRASVARVSSITSRYIGQPPEDLATRQTILRTKPPKKLPSGSTSITASSSPHKIRSGLRSGSKSGHMESLHTFLSSLDLPAEDLMFKFRDAGITDDQRLMLLARLPDRHGWMTDNIPLSRFDLKIVDDGLANLVQGNR
ncbi:uncharacterized protein FIBRA_04167 [Fibroporia radiculosa]|uniref:Methyltransferase type 11 domain-containing protein n=1 Tax=Fibroporia radiculosa TaxID=599839 RepID=J4GNY6_9APHY|nr:uncharacterized protein FIBRA_04167 [Fibroporia radiculosa]CCM02090.1 predicted protein [Fibroporia radiculosa]